MRKTFILAIVSFFMVGALVQVVGAENLEQGGKGMKLISSAFENNGFIPRIYTCQGADINPPLTIENIPEGTKSLALIVDDPDAPMGTWIHWVVFNIPVINTIKENNIPGTQGINDFRKLNYGGPCPPSGTHRYFFKIYALDTKLDFEAGIDKETLEEAMEGHILGQAKLVGLYEKKSKGHFLFW